MGRSYSCLKNRGSLNGSNIFWGIIISYGNFGGFALENALFGLVIILIIMAPVAWWLNSTCFILKMFQTKLATKIIIIVIITIIILIVTLHGQVHCFSGICLIWEVKLTFWCIVLLSFQMFNAMVSPMLLYDGHVCNFLYTHLLWSCGYYSTRSTISKLPWFTWI